MKRSHSRSFCAFRRRPQRPRPPIPLSLLIRNPSAYRQRKGKRALELDWFDVAQRGRRTHGSGSQCASRAAFERGNLAVSGRAPAVAPTPEGILPIDFNYDFKTDLVLAGAGGIRLMRQDSPTAFTDVTAKTRLPKSVLNASYTGAWAVDVEADGDLDIVLGQASGLPIVLRNNGDGTFTAIHPFAEISRAYASLSGPTSTKTASPMQQLLDNAGHLHVFINQRAGKFSETCCACRVCVGQSHHRCRCESRRPDEPHRCFTQRRHRAPFLHRQRAGLEFFTSGSDPERFSESGGRCPSPRRRYRQQRRHRSPARAGLAVGKPGSRRTYLARQPIGKVRPPQPARRPAPSLQPRRCPRRWPSRAAGPYVGRSAARKT